MFVCSQSKSSGIHELIVVLACSYICSSSPGCQVTEECKFLEKSPLRIL
uniref:Uncharacterized protein n=1 Tax=Rhizophora mucronata TaxID=61149 RepID=A0A2P2QCQ5_RHIMU